MNLMPGEAKDGQATLASGFTVSVPTSLEGPITIGVRPQHFRVATDHDQGAVELTARLENRSATWPMCTWKRPMAPAFWPAWTPNGHRLEGASCPIVIDRDRHHCFDSAGQQVDQLIMA